MNKTVSYVAAPCDSRCRWWSVRIPKDYDIGDLNDKESLRPLGFLKSGADIELDEGDAILDSEAVHHSKNRGYVVKIAFVINGELKWFSVNMAVKERMKEWATPEQWAILKDGSGDVAACLRVFMARQMGFEFPKKKEAEKLLAIETPLDVLISSVLK